MAFETDLLEFGDIFKGSSEIKKKVSDLKKQAISELKTIDKIGGLKVAIENGYMKKKLVLSQTERQKNIESGIQKVIGVNCYTEGVKSPLMESEDGGFMKADQKLGFGISNQPNWCAMSN